MNYRTQTRRRKVWRRISILLMVIGAGLLLIPPGQWALAAFAQYRLEQRYVSMGGGGTTAAPQEEDETDSGFPERPVESGNVFNRMLASLWEDPALELPAHLDDEWTKLNRPNPELLKNFPGAMIRIPAIKTRAIVLYGTSLRTLAQGPAFYEVASLPGEEGNVAIAGHRTTYGAWFRHLDQLQPGDDVELEYQGVTYRYEVERVWVINRDDWSVVSQTDDPVLTLTTCHPPGSASQRLALRARLAETIYPNWGPDGDG